VKPRVVFVVGGLASRLKPVSEEIPKCMVDLGGKPLIQHQIEFLRDRGYTSFVFCVAHLADKVREYFGDGSFLGVEIAYSTEPESLLGTAGAVKLVEDIVGDVCVVFYGDEVTSLDLDEVLDFHSRKASDFTVVVRELPSGYKSSSILTLDDVGRIDFFIEKPSRGEIEELADRKRFINNGIYVVNKSVFGFIPEGLKYDFATDLIPDLISRGLGVYSFVSSDFFRELGTVKKYEDFRSEVDSKGSVLE